MFVDPAWKTWIRVIRERERPVSLGQIASNYLPIVRKVTIGWIPIWITFSMQIIKTLTYLKPMHREADYLLLIVQKRKYLEHLRLRV